MEAVGLALSIVAAIDTCLKYGHALFEVCHAFRKADEEIEHRVVLIESSVLRIGSQLQLIQQIHEELDDDFKGMQIRLFNTFIAKLKDVLGRFEKVVDRVTDEHGVLQFKIKRGKYIFVKQHLDSAIDEMERWQTRFDPTWKLVMLRSAGPSVDLLLDQDARTKSTQDSATTSLRAMGNLRHVVRDGQSSGISVLLPANQLSDMDIQSIPFSAVELYRQSSPKRCYVVDTIDPLSAHSTKRGLKAMAKNVRSLAEKLQFVETSRIGMLQCKGFVKREEGGFRLIFRQPPQTESSRPPRSLRAMMISATDHSLTERVNLAKQLARAVSYIHSLGFVHKNIRPETIIGFWIEEHSVNLESIFLMGFGQFRAEDGGTSLIGDAEWEKNLYRHPNRQGIHPEEDYVMQHDIYSLGVCLLEIGLWTSMVTYDSEKPNTGEGLGSSMTNFGAQPPDDLKSSLVLMAKNRLPSVMGDRYCEIVVNCLTCLDDSNADFADITEFQDETGLQIGVKYIEKIMLRLEDIEV